MKNVKIGCLLLLVLWLVCLAGAYFFGGLIVWAVWNHIVLKFVPTLPYVSFWLCGIVGLILGQIFGVHPSIHVS